MTVALKRQTNRETKSNMLEVPNLKRRRIEKQKVIC